MGKTIDGRYMVQNIIGVGGMAVVYKAMDIQENRTVAIKILKDEYMSDSQFKRSFITESKAIAMMSHRNIVKILDVGFRNDLHYIVMEHIDGITLKQYIEQQGPLRWKETVFFAYQILQAIQHAHSHGIVHRDIKPQNIMLLSDGTIKVTDFGIARFSNSNTATMTDKAIGSVHYISPEQVSGKKIDNRSDIYSVGVLMYEMLTGKLPFDAENPVSIAIMQLQTSPKKLRTINDSVPEGLEEIVLKAMAKEPEMRYQTAQEMLDDIDRFKQNPSIRFEYKYFVDDQPTRYIDAIKNIQSTERERAVEETEEYEKKSPFLNVLAGILAAFLVVGGMVALFMIYILPNNGGDVAEDIAIPPLVGIQYETAVERYGEDFTLVALQPKNSDEYAAGVIMSQDPADGMMVKPGAEIRVVVSLGKEVLKMPDYVNRDVRTAEIGLTGMGIKYKIEREYHDTIVEDYVISTDPVANTELTGDEEVLIKASMGKEIKNVDMPQLVGKSADDAKLLLTTLKLVLGSTEQEDSDRPKGEVIRQSIPKDLSIPEGTTVDITVSSGKPVEPVEKEKTVPVLLPKEKESTQVVLVMNGSTVYDETIQEPNGQVLYVPVTGTGVQTVDVYVDGVHQGTHTIDFGS